MDDLKIEPWDPRLVGDELLAEVHGLRDAWRAEALPSDEPTPLDVALRRMRIVKSDVEPHRWIARTGGGQAVGFAYADIEDVPDNRHILFPWVFVHRDHRRRGIGRALVREVVELGEREGKTHLIGGTVSTSADAAAALAAMGMALALEMKVNELELRSCDRADVDGLVSEGERRGAAEGYELTFHDGPTPAEDKPAMARLIEVMNDAPRGDLEMEDFVVTPEMMEIQEAAWEAAGHRRWTLVARHVASGELAGFTGVGFDDGERWIVHQGGTGVVPAHRGHGLGLWLKAAMLQRILEGLPEARIIRTENAFVNRWMLAINDRLGFRHVRDETEWQAPLATVAGWARR